MYWYTFLLYYWFYYIYFSVSNECSLCEYKRLCSKILLISNVWTLKYIWPSNWHANAKLHFLLIHVNLLFWKWTPVFLQRPARKVLRKNIWIHLCITTSWNIIGKSWKIIGKKSEKGMLGEYQFRKDRKGIEKVLWSFAVDSVLSEVHVTCGGMWRWLLSGVRVCACLRASLEREGRLIGCNEGREEENRRVSYWHLLLRVRTTTVKPTQRISHL